jgi:dTDP-4-amino-4,6-dideoxygalactose transaminase
VFQHGRYARSDQMTTKKRQRSDLAVHGGAPAFAEAIHVGRPNIGDRERLFSRINDLLDRRWLTNNGKYVVEFERRVAETIGAAHCVAMSNATVSLEIAIRALGLSGEVLVPSFTFVATVNALQWHGLTPVFCDVDPASHTIDFRAAETRITPRTMGILGVHLWGHPCYIDELADLAKRHHLKLLFDASHAFGSSYKKRMIGNFGNAEVLSFHATKFLNTFEGGAVVTNDDDLARKMRLMRNHGFITLDEVACVGTNAKMSEVSAVMGITGLESLEDFVTINRSHYKQYQQELSGIPGISLLPYQEDERCNYQYVVIEVDAEQAQITRDELVRILRAENVFARRYFYPGCHRMQPYLRLYPEAARFLPKTERLTERVLCLPTGTVLNSADITTICQIIRLALGFDT